jgi:hypothetical protein
MEKIAKQTYLLTFPSQKEMTKSLLRFQEHYESPEFAGKLFSLKEFKEWYKTTKKHGKFTYYTDWNGFNFPFYAVTPFKINAMRNITKREKKIVDLLKNIKGEYYVIAVHGDDPCTLEHELTHAMYCLVPAYQKKVQALLKRHEYKLTKLYTWLIGIGYSKDPYILRDEANAYMTCDNDYLYEEDVEYPEKLGFKLENLRDQYIEEFING